jgi:hypothetical protein
MTAPDVITNTAGIAHDAPAIMDNPLIRAHHAREITHDPRLSMRRNQDETFLRDAV